MSFRNSIENIVPPWLAKGVAQRIGYVVGLMLDAYTDQVREGIKARFPGEGTSDALGPLGRDRQMERGPTETDTGYAARLSGAFDAWRRAGSAYAILTQLRAYSPSDWPPMRAVSNRAVWHEIDTTTGAVTKTVDGTNWQWDPAGAAMPFRQKNHRGWIIIQGSTLWEIDEWGADGEWGDGGVWGSNMTDAEGRALAGIIRKWKDARSFVPTVIVTFDDALFLAAADPVDNPNGTPDWNRPATRLLTNANYWSAIRT